MAIKITGKIGDLSVDLSIEATDDLKVLIAELSRGVQDDNTFSEQPQESVDRPVKLDVVSDNKGSKPANFFEKSLDFIKQQGTVTNYQLIDFLADSGAEDVEIKRTMMRLKHSHFIQLETIAGPGQSSYLKFHWHG
ncbi:hypothetical protein H0A36_22840 [Endozoicomonas sp. SM1973]|uniref:Uncharacterized protein n=1 Tax=Spartinivicinus marinus TaxID=2994442 RepID=A0A853I4M2_9GAMM|nr:hypothetical protein [Spartinivicinus marinus]MCX4025870.1 hypothetical protein [Spartinivicinus marinus]NYZ68860.1 hypothetical protein [Spartinivicinus marinus]